MRSVTAFEAKTRFGKLPERVAQGAAVAGLREVRRRIAARLGGKRKLTQAQVKFLIEEGRR